MKRYRRSDRTFGPSVLVDENGPRAQCLTSSHYCVFYIGGTCTHQKPSKKIPDPFNTPDWCEMKASMLRDVADAIARETKPA